MAEGELLQLADVGRTQGRHGPLQQVLKHRLPQRGTLLGIRPPAELVEQDQGLAVRLREGPLDAHEV